MKKLSCIMLMALFAVILASVSGYSFTRTKSSLDKKINVAVVAGFIQPFHELASAFESKYGIKVEPTFSSAGRFYGQIINSAPYDVFLSADEEKPALLLAKGLAETPFIYARGEVVLWSAKKGFCKFKNWRDAIKQQGKGKIAMANPDVAVYGMSAKKALQDTGMWESFKPQLINAQDLAQVFQYASMGAVDAGFCNLFQANSKQGRKGCYYSIKEAPIVTHAACVLKRTKKREAALLFSAFLVSSEAERIKKKYGYK